ncbi:hypothetical protein BU24DRAFT_418825 [Aaosphaeria arxii CBS 175.79]|uniref:Uncharacterized protein n=1 Tax=Aaosphaeria arxii CBS 175.79 TaxID=1450172 RepID=A0A6A5Y1Z3_9PLEO|nr:uncharacterized protein BU24DRAFT_418825 [Aaosphaeria arxii CBS 175.79]KAF2019239.1 hypothetical protein BU24DRAFT_418825 [Aaosphaeria arxii CBS 175.79]
MREIKPIDEPNKHGERLANSSPRQLKQGPQSPELSLSSRRAADVITRARGTPKLGHAPLRMLRCDRERFLGFWCLGVRASLFMFGVLPREVCSADRLTVGAADEQATVKKRGEAFGGCGGDEWVGAVLHSSTRVWIHMVGWSVLMSTYYCSLCGT